MGCCFCCLGEDGQVKRVIVKFPAQRLANAAPNFINLVVGRVGPATSTLQTPLSMRPCVFYHVEVWEYVTRTVVETDGDNQRVERVEQHWEFRFDEERSCDFYLLDPVTPQASMYIPGNSVPVKRHTEIKAVSESGMSPGYYNLMSDGIVMTPGQAELCIRNGFSLSPWHKMRYTEYAFVLGDQVAALGIVRDGITSTGAPVRQMEALTENLLNDQYFEANKWDEWDKKSWKALTVKPAIICTNDLQFQQAISIPPI